MVKRLLLIVLTILYSQKLSTPISNGGLILTPPGYIADAAKAGSQSSYYCLPPMEGPFTLSHLLICRFLPVL